mgnify:CR=1 FL=1
MGDIPGKVQLYKALAKPVHPQHKGSPTAPAASQLTAHRLVDPRAWADTRRLAECIVGSLQPTPAVAGAVSVGIWPHVRGAHSLTLSQAFVVVDLTVTACTPTRQH